MQNLVLQKSCWNTTTEIYRVSCQQFPNKRHCNGSGARGDHERDEDYDAAVHGSLISLDLSTLGGRLPKAFYELLRGGFGICQGVEYAG
jgi:hypothetical protein